jgi:two-component system, OmpR family, sensor histidine kinase KdpD
MPTNTASANTPIPPPPLAHEGVRLHVRSAWTPAARLLTWAGSVTLVTLISLLPTPYIQHTTAALLYTLVVLINAVVSGLWVGVGTSLLAFAALNYFFMTPYQAIGITSVEDAVRLGTFLCVAVVVSGLAGRARDHAAHAMRHAAHLDALYRLSQAISAEVERERILPSISDTTLRLFNAQACQIALLDDTGALVVHASSGTLPSDDSMGWCIECPIPPAGHSVGTLTVLQHEMAPPLSAAEHDVLQMIATQVALVLERAKLVETTHHARVLAEANHVKSTLLSSVSHDFRTPLAVMKGAVSNLLDESVPWEPRMQQELLRSIDREITRLDRLVGDLLVMSRIEAGALEQTRRWHDLPELAEQVMLRLGPVLAHHRVTVEIPDDLPPVYVTYTHIDRVLTNLLENAAYHTPPGTAITVRAREQGGMLEVVVFDTGPGFPDSVLPHLFEKFVRGGDSERHTEGSGLGLAICKGLVAAHGGTMSATNRAEGGACVTFTLPREVGAERHAARPVMEVGG